MGQDIRTMDKRPTTIVFDTDLPNGPYIDETGMDSFDAHVTPATNWQQIADLFVEHVHKVGDEVLQRHYDDPQFGSAGQVIALSGQAKRQFEATSTTFTMVVDRIHRKGADVSMGSTAEEGPCVVFVTVTQQGYQDYSKYACFCGPTKRNQHGEAVPCCACM
jgi:hypothetical protein